MNTVLVPLDLVTVEGICLQYKLYNFLCAYIHYVYSNILHQSRKGMEFALLYVRISWSYIYEISTGLHQ